MARHDFRCPECGDVYTDIDVPVSVGAQQANLRCPNPLHATAQSRIPYVPPRLEWVPAAPAMDFGPSGGAGFKGFTIEEEIRGTPQRIQIDSLADLRRVERDSEIRARNGEGRPLVWRDYQQDGSNRDVHTLCANLADPHGVRETITPKVQSGTVTPRRGDAVTAVHGTA